MQSNYKRKGKCAEIFSHLQNREILSELCKYIVLITFPEVKYENIYKIENSAMNKIFSVL